MTYNFAQQMSIGDEQEHRLDEYLSRYFTISPATRDEQRLGIDRHFTDKRTGRSFSVEYKSDKTAGRTGNAFIETISVDIARKLGWAYTSQALYLFYLVVDPAVLYVLTFAKLRSQLARWAVNYPSRSIPNEGYRTEGILVPLDEIERHSVAVLNI